MGDKSGMCGADVRDGGVPVHENGVAHDSCQHGWRGHCSSAAQDGPPLTFWCGLKCDISGEVNSDVKGRGDQNFEPCPCPCPVKAGCPGHPTKTTKVQESTFYTYVLMTHLKLSKFRKP